MYYSTFNKDNICVLWGGYGIKISIIYYLITRGSYMT